MKTKILFSFLLVLFFQQVKAQNSRVWATYYGGAIYDAANCVVTDASGNVYMAGVTSSTSGVASGGFQNTYGGGTYDAFLVKFDASGNRIWATYYGGNNTDFALDIAIDDAGNVYLSGGTKSTSGIASGGFQNTHGGGSYDGFLVKFDSAGNRIWSTYYGGTGWEEARSISTDTAGNVYITGFTNSTSGIASGGFQNTYAGGTYDSFLVKFNSAGNRLWATYYGGPGNEGYDGNGVATDNFGNVYLTGWTSSTTGISSGGFQNSLGGATDVFLVKFNSAGSRVWATYYGGTGDEGAISNILYGKNVATDLSGNIYLSGTTQSTTGIASSGFQNTYGGGTNDCYLVKFDSTGNRSWGTYYGGTGDERGWGVATDAAGNAYLTGRTNSTSAIASGGFQTTNFGNYDAFLVTFSPSGSRHCATYYGGTGGEWVYAPAIDPFGNIYLSGFTYSTSGIASGGFQNTFAGGTYDAFLVKFTSCAPTAQCSIAFQVNDVTCSGTCDGSATALVTGGTSPYTYSWTPTGQNTPTIAGLCAGNYSCTITANGVSCTDSVTVVANTPTTSTTTVSECDSYTWNNTTYTSSGTYTWLGTNAVGCDSAATLNLTLSPSTTAGDVTTSICAGDSYTWPANGVSYTTAQSATTYVSGCNTATLNLSITPATTTGSVTTSMCAGESYTWPANGVSYTTAQSGTTYISGCNTATLNLSITPATTTGSVTTSICAGDSYTWPANGVSYTTAQSGTTYISGCNTATLSLSITPATTTGSVTTSMCAGESYTWPANGVSYTTAQSGTIYVSGCNTATLNLSIAPATTTGSVTTSICAGESYTWPANGVSYTTAQSGITYVSGCNTATLNLSIAPATTTGSVTTSICAGESYTWPANGVSYTTAQSGTTHVSGCNTATLNLNVTPAPSMPIINIFNNNVLSIPSQANASYQWISCVTGLDIANQTDTTFSATANGEYAVEVSNSCGTATSDCVTLDDLSLDEIGKTISIYPNPSHAEIIISRLGNAEIEFQINDATGRLIISGTTSNQNNEIDVNTLSRGIYYLILNGFSPIKFVKE